MVSFRKVALLVALARLSGFTTAVPLEGRDQDACAHGIYGELVPVLADYSAAQSYCTAYYPVTCSKDKAEKRWHSTVSSCDLRCKGGMMANMRLVFQSYHPLCQFDHER